MDKIRQGNAIHLALSVKVNNTYIDFGGVEIILFDVRLDKKFSTLRLAGVRAVRGTVLTFDIAAAETSKQAGDYRAVLHYAYEGKQYAVDALVFELVATTEEATLAPDDESEVVEVVKVESTIDADVIFAAVAAAEQAEAVAEAGEITRNASEASRVSAESDRATAERERATTETSRVSAETTRQNNEQSRRSAEATRGTSEAERIDNEASRLTSEASRVVAEADRAEAESAREVAENERTAAETSRASAETIRQNNEQSRRSAEATRGTSEAERIHNEASRSLAEASRVLAETDRAEAEGERAVAEKLRVSAESDRVAAEEARAAAMANKLDKLATPIGGRVVESNDDGSVAESDIEVANIRQIGTYDPYGRDGLADNLYPDTGSEDTVNWQYRTTGGSADLSNGVAQLDNIKGQLVKQYVKNGNFAEWTDGVPNGWFFGCTSAASYIENLEDELHIVMTDPALGLHQTFANIVVEHKYYYAIRTRTVSGSGASGLYMANATPNPIIYTTPNHSQWRIDSYIWTATLDGTLAIRSLGPNDSYIDKFFGIRLIDLTELGLGTLLTTAAQCDAHFGNAYIPESISAANPTSLISDGFNQFDAATMIIAGKAINATTGAIEDDATKSILRIPCLLSEVGTGKNNGYRIYNSSHASMAEVVGWNPFSNESGAFDSVYDIATPDYTGHSPYVDYSANGQGFLYVQVTTANAVGAVVHFKWSYDNTQLSEKYANESAYWSDRLPIDFGELRGLRRKYYYMSDNFDEINLISRKKVAKTHKHVVTGAENWWKVSNYFAASGLIPGNQSLTGLANNGYSFGSMSSGDKKFVVDTGGNVVIRNDAYTTAAAFKAHLAELYAAGTPLTIYYVLATPVVTDIPATVRSTYRVADFGTERLTTANNVYPALTTTEYFANYKDFIRKLKERSDTGNGLASNDELVTNLATKASQSFGVGTPPATEVATTAMYNVGQLYTDSTTGVLYYLQSVTYDAETTTYTYTWKTIKFE